MTNKSREQLYDSEKIKAQEAVRGDFPICNLCGCSILPGRKWHESHNKYLPRALGGSVDGIAHDRCNLKHNNDHDTPLVAKRKRVRQKHIGAFRPRTKFPGGKNSDRYRKVSGEVVLRATGERA